MTYEELVTKRKNYKVQIPGLINQRDVENNLFDEGNYLDPWAKWHNSIPADIMLIGQDWGSTSYYLKNNGRDQDMNPTCRNLSLLFNELGIQIGDPNNPALNQKFHFANIIPFLRTGDMQGGLNKILSQAKINEFAEEFIKPLIEVVKPTIIITLGRASTTGVMSVFGQTLSTNRIFKDFVEASPIKLKENLLLFPMYHCGSSSVNRNRNLDEQKQDWSKIKEYI
ncbi:uracil-DNA glycosylase family protein [Mucilaginibacter paludis]|uniref:Uracil-DNA glycosylase-like domain-containing protein n=1 Tax=Mucilaginibacter paludis DSM 18603 TaxID=714943 RepID=H1Y586_9SPHI|nr:hypothetical protein [Mucilaginibacter paludis]EHQ28629.1 hypothetical protein Mucpa_4539 [Mucilaginibacter paludis DSM 18603]